MRKLTVTSGPAAGQSIPLDHDLVIGREGADLTIPDPELSRRHVIIRPGPSGVVVEDLGSTNGTRVAGVRINEPVTVTSPTTIEIGTTTIQLDVPAAGATRLSDRPITEAGQSTRIRGVPDLQTTRAAGHPVEPPPPPPAAEPQPAAQAAPPPAPPAAPPSAPAGVPPDVPPGAAQGGPPAGGRPSGRVIGAVLVAAVVVAGVIIAITATGGGSSTKTYALNAQVQTMALGSPASTSISGIFNGTPLGRVSVIFQRFLASIPSPGSGPTTMKLLILISSERGLIELGANGTVELTKSGSEVVHAYGLVSMGTGTYAGARGSFSLTGGHDQLGAPIDTLTLLGKLQY